MNQHANDRDGGGAAPTPAPGGQPPFAVTPTIPFYPLEDLTDHPDHPDLKNAERMAYGKSMVPCLGRYPIIKALGSGGMGVVYYTVHPTLYKDHALKVLRNEYVQRNPDAPHRLKQEALNSTFIDSKHVVKVDDYVENVEKKLYYIVMEFVPGESAEKILQRIGKPGLDEAIALKIMIAACAGLKAAHDARIQDLSERNGIVHRDIKPANILVPYSRPQALHEHDYDAAKLADFGLAKSVFEGPLPANLARPFETKRNEILGTPGYMPYEQYLSSRVGKTADVFAMGATFYTLLTGQAPFQCPEGNSDPEFRQAQIATATQNEAFRPSAEIRRGVSEATARVIDRCLRTDAVARFNDASDLLAALIKLRDKAEPPPPEENIELDLGGGVSMAFVRVKSGKFRMGADDGSPAELPAHDVCITKDFYIAKFPVTVAQFRRFITEERTLTDAEKPYAPPSPDPGRGGYALAGGSMKFTPGACWKTPGFLQTDEHPVVLVSWKDTQRFMEWLAKKECRAAHSSSAAAPRPPAARREFGVRLPYEAEWEYAARGANGLLYPWGNRFEPARCNHRPKSTKEIGRTSPVGSFQNASWCGAFDMVGNVWEWCLDWHSGTYYHTSPAEDPIGPADGNAHMLRGGSWYDTKDSCRSSFRIFGGMTLRGSTYGFRVVLDFGVAER